MVAFGFRLKRNPNGTVSKFTPDGGQLLKANFGSTTRARDPKYRKGASAASAVI